MDKILPNWYSKKRTKAQRRTIYRFLRLMGFSVNVATKVRDWSNGHLRTFIAHNEFCRVKDERTESEN